MVYFIALDKWINLIKDVGISNRSFKSLINQKKKLSTDFKTLFLKQNNENTFLLIISAFLSYRNQITC